MMGGEFLNQVGDSRELIPREGIRNDEYSPMRMLIIEKLNR
jgi:hypothetical protein